MKSPKLMNPEEATHASQIGRLLLTTAANSKHSSDSNRVTAGEWWEAQIKRLQKHFAQSER